MEWVLLIVCVDTVVTCTLFTAEWRNHNHCRPALASIHAYSCLHSHPCSPGSHACAAWALHAHPCPTICLWTGRRYNNYYRRPVPDPLHAHPCLQCSRPNLRADNARHHSCTTNDRHCMSNRQHLRRHEVEYGDGEHTSPSVSDISNAKLCVK